MSAFEIQIGTDINNKGSISVYHGSGNSCAGLASTTSKGGAIVALNADEIDALIAGLQIAARRIREGSK